MITKICLDTNIIINAFERRSAIELALFEKLIQNANFKLFYSEQTLREIEAGLVNINRRQDQKDAIR